MNESEIAAERFRRYLRPHPVYGNPCRVDGIRVVRGEHDRGAINDLRRQIKPTPFLGAGDDVRQL